MRKVKITLTQENTLKYRLYVDTYSKGPVAIADHLNEDYLQACKNEGIKTKLLASSNSIESLSILTTLGERLSISKINLN